MNVRLTPIERTVRLLLALQLGALAGMLRFNFPQTTPWILGAALALLATAVLGLRVLLATDNLIAQYSGLSIQGSIRRVVQLCSFSIER